MCAAGALSCAMSGLMQRAAIASLFDHLVGAGKQRGRHRNADRL
jgi:hypothetical protein